MNYDENKIIEWGMIMKEKIKSLASYLTGIYIVIMGVIFPFYFSNGYVSIGTDKAMFFRYSSLIFLGLMLTLFLFLKVNEKAMWEYFLVIFWVTTVVSFLLCDYKETSFLGEEGWYIGLFTQTVFVGIYFVLSRFLKWEKWYTYVFGCSTFLVFLHGLLNRFSIYPIDMKVDNTGFISTLGNINWFTGYWSVIFPVGVGLLLFGGCAYLWQKICLVIYTILGTAVGVTQGSDSAGLVFVCVVLMVYCITARQKAEQKNFWLLLALMSGTCQGIRIVRLIFPEAMNYSSSLADAATNSNFTLYVFLLAVLISGGYLWADKKQSIQEKTDLKTILTKWIFRIRMGILGCIGVGFILLIVFIAANTLNPGSIGRLSDSPLFTFNQKWGSSRGITWEAGIRAYGAMPVHEKLLGAGPDCFASKVYLEEVGVLDSLQEHFGSSRLTNAHNEWITVLVNQGAIGLTANMGFFISLGVICIKRRKEHPLLAGIGMGIFSYMVHNVFSFQQTLNGSMVYLIAGIAGCILLSKPNEHKMCVLDKEAARST